MKLRQCIRWMVALGACAAVLGPTIGCKKRADVQSELSRLEKSVETGPATNTAASGPAAVQPATGPAEANAYVNAAVAAVRRNDYVGGVTALQQVPQARGATPQQLMSAERTKQAIINDLQVRAERGDAAAKAALAAIERTRSQ